MSFPLALPQDAPLVTVTHPKPSLWIIELHNGDDNRLTAALVNNGLKPALDAVERDWRNNLKPGPPTKDTRGKEGGKGALIIVGNRSQDKFFSNGLDFDNLRKDPHYTINFFPVIYNPLMRRLLSYPIPVIAALNGHTFAGGMILAMCCDYRVMIDGTKRNAWMSMNEVHFGAALPLSLVSAVHAKCGDARTRRKIFLEGHRFTPPEALEAGLVDYVAGDTTEAVLSKATEVAATLEQLPQFGGYGIIKRELYREVLEDTMRDTSLGDVLADDQAAKARL